MMLPPDEPPPRDDLPPGALPHPPAADRNLGPIRDALRELLPARGLLLEVAAGTGVHAARLAPEFPEVRWLPTEADPDRRESIEAWRRAVEAENLLPARELDARDHPWPVRGPVDAVLAVNLTHIAPWEVTCGLVRGAGGALAPEGRLLIYGAFRVDGRATPASNRAFDESLRARNPDWGLRDIDDVAAAAAEHGLQLEERRPMPSHNWVLVLRRG